MTPARLANYQEQGWADSLPKAQRNLKEAIDATPGDWRGKFVSGIRFSSVQGQPGYKWTWTLKALTALY